MKRFLFTLTLASFVFIGFSQESLINLTGGYSWMKLDDSEYFSEDPNITGTGWRINATYDFNLNEGPVAYGFSVGYISVDASYSGVTDTADYKMSSVPFYFAPKYLFGNEKFRGFIKVMLGAQSASLKRTTSTGEITASDFGFYGGAGAGLMFFVTEMVFINTEYEIAYVTNNYYRNGLMQSAMLGIGVKF